MTKSKALDRPFDPKVLAKAKVIAAKYRLILEANDEVGFLGRAVELPYVMADGPTVEKCVHEVREALTTVVAYMFEEGQVPPSAATDERRSAQVNIRLTEEEKFLLEETARSKGFRGISDYLRSIAMSDMRYSA